MGCYSYYVDDKMIRFSDFGDGCLCTFPLNDGHTLTPSRIKDLAKLGAAVHLTVAGDIDGGYIDECLPEWINKELDRVIGED